jgi:AcrR family transcriptional regulator
MPMKATARRTYRMGARAAAMEATRTRILEAAFELYLERRYDNVTLQDVAAAADVSVQTIVNHFGSKEALLETLAGWLRERVEIAREAPPGDLERIVAVLFDDYERLGDANVRWAADAEHVPAVAGVLEAARAHHRAWLERVFADRLPKRGRAREHALNLHYAATDVFLWKLWRRDLGLSRAEAERGMRDLLTAIDPRKDT